MSTRGAGPVLRGLSRDRTRQQIELIRRSKDAEAAELVRRKSEAGRGLAGVAVAAVSRSLHEFVEVTALGRQLVAEARKLREQGLTPAQAASLFSQVGAELSRRRGGLTRAEWLELCAEMYDRGESTEGRA